MTPRSVHPSLEEWSLWLDGEVTDERKDELHAHHESCKRCKKDVAFLKDVSRAKARRQWTAPPSNLSRRARRRPEEDVAPRAPRRSKNVTWAPADVRGGIGAAGQSRMVSEVFPQAEIGIVAIPPEREGEWHIEGRVWLRKPDERAIKVLLVHGEHVIATTEVQDGGYFELDEVVGTGWTIELHLPTGETLTLKDPQA